MSRILVLLLLACLSQNNQSASAHVPLVELRACPWCEPEYKWNTVLQRKPSYSAHPGFIGSTDTGWKDFERFPPRSPRENRRNFELNLEPLRGLTTPQREPNHIISSHRQAWFPKEPGSSGRGKVQGSKGLPLMSRSLTPGPNDPEFGRQVGAKPLGAYHTTELLGDLKENQAGPVVRDEDTNGEGTEPLEPNPLRMIQAYENPVSGSDEPYNRNLGAWGSGKENTAFGDPVLLQTDSSDPETQRLPRTPTDPVPSTTVGLPNLWDPINMTPGQEDSLENPINLSNKEPAPLARTSSLASPNNFPRPNAPNYSSPEESNDTDYLLPRSPSPINISPRPLRSPSSSRTTAGPPESGNNSGPIIPGPESLPIVPIEFLDEAELGGLYNAETPSDYREPNDNEATPDMPAPIELELKSPEPRTHSLGIRDLELSPAAPNNGHKERVQAIPFSDLIEKWSYLKLDSKRLKAPPQA